MREEDVDDGPPGLPIKSTLWHKQRSTSSSFPQGDRLKSSRKCYDTTSLALSQRSKGHAAPSLNPFEILNSIPSRNCYVNNNSRLLVKRKKGRTAKKAPTLTPLELQLVSSSSRKKYRTTTLVPRKKSNFAVPKIPPFPFFEAAARSPVSKLVSTPFKSSDSLQVNLKNQTKRLEENMQSLTNVKSLRVKLRSQAKRLEDSIHSLTNVQSLQVNLRNKAKKLEESLFSLRNAQPPTQVERIEGIAVTPPAQKYHEALCPITELSEHDLNDVASQGCLPSETTDNAQTSHRRANKDSFQKSSHLSVLSKSTMHRVAGLSDAAESICESTGPSRQSSLKLGGRQRTRRSIGDDSLQRSTLSGKKASGPKSPQRTSKAQAKEVAGFVAQNISSCANAIPIQRPIDSNEEVMAVVLESSQALAFPFAVVHEPESTEEADQSPTFCESDSSQTSPATAKTENMSLTSDSNSESSIQKPPRTEVDAVVNESAIADEPLAVALPIAELIDHDFATAQNDNGISQHGPEQIEMSVQLATTEPESLVLLPKKEANDQTAEDSLGTTSTQSASHASDSKKQPFAKSLHSEPMEHGNNASQGSFATPTRSYGGDSKRPVSTKNSTCCSTITGIIHLREVTFAMERFASKERPLKEQMNGLSERERNCTLLLRQFWEADHQPLPGNMYLCFARACQFDVRKGRRNLTNFDLKYLDLTVVQLESQLLTLVRMVG